MEDEAIAHTKLNPDGVWAKHSLEQHLVKVADIAAEKATCFGSSDWSRLAGLWHDLGKYRPAFQAYIKGNSEAHIQQRVPVDRQHSSAGAVHAERVMGAKGLILAYLIAGHHAGLPDWETPEAGRSGLKLRLDNAKKKRHLEEVKEAIKNKVAENVLHQIQPHTTPIGGSNGLHLWMRMLFSCLVDADFLDTERFMDLERADRRESTYSLDACKNQFDHYIEQKQAAAPPSVVNKIRKEILGDCLNAAEHKPGVFSLTVPTGGGKTLSGMAFALAHALRYGKRRVIIAIPYTSIIEQTASQYREIFGDAVIEHHSNLDPQLEQENSRSRLATENWDAPIIVTTNVQLLESLFAARSSRCRKLHHIVNSVIIMDEAQLLPPEFLQPTLDVLNLLVNYYSVSLVMSTATQPALSTRKDHFGKTILRGLDSIHEIIPNSKELNTKLNRVLINMPDDMKVRSGWEDIADQLLAYESVLAIVNTRKDSLELLSRMPLGTFYLSGLMCGQHRSNVIHQIKEKLKAGEAIRVVSTQLVEAGVDLDFPVVYRALTGLDSIVQAAGRCNREGKLEKGRVVVFIPPNQPPKGMLRFAEQATQRVVSLNPANLLDSSVLSSYFEHYFNQANLDAKGIEALLTKDAQCGYVQFRSAAKKFNIIDDDATHNILVPYNQEAEEWIGILRSKNTNASLARYAKRKLQRYSVSIYEGQCQELKKIGAIEEIDLGIWVVCVTNAYDEEKGLVPLKEMYSGSPEAWLV